MATGGKSVLLVEAGRGLGGTCLFEGCIPSKIFCETAARRREFGHAAMFGLQSGTDQLPGVDWPTVQARRHNILTRRAGGALQKTA